MEERPLNPTEFASAVTAVSSAFGDATRRDIFLLVHASPDGLTATEVADQTDLHTNVARHHLDKLASGGYIEVRTDPPGEGRAGRPSKRYRAAAPQQSPQLPVRQDPVLVSLLNRALAMLPQAEAEAMAEEVGEEYGLALAQAMGDINESQRSFRSSLHMVADALTAHGFAAHIEGDTKDELRIVTQHCPFGGGDVVHPVICAVDRGMVKGMLGSLYGETNPDQMSAVITGDDICTTTVPSPA